MKKKQAANYLEYIPVRNPATEFTQDSAGIITLKKEWTGFYSRIAQKFFHKPRFSKIALDGYGSFIWKSIDGCKDVYALSKELDEAFPDMEKSLPRLIKFLEILASSLCGKIKPIDSGPPDKCRRPLDILREACYPHHIKYF